MKQGKIAIVAKQLNSTVFLLGDLQRFDGIKSTHHFTCGPRDTYLEFTLYSKSDGSR
ncbi:MAG: hypothetical protein K0R51_3461 [Cytophagaceae bacterium]|jgi:hypothetical protein|nr:hypothetical protein [Cytophagaceae bacterium]